MNGAGLPWPRGEARAERGPTGGSLLGRHAATRRLGAWGGAGTAVVVGLFVAAYLVEPWLTADDLRRWVNLDGEANLPTWWSTCLLAFGAAGAGAVAGLQGDVALRRAWAVVALAVGYLGLDEATHLHERLEAPMADLGVSVGAYHWVVAGAGLALAGSLVLVRMGRRLPARAGRRLGAALATYGAGAIGMEAVGGLVEGSWGKGWAFAVTVVVEEGLEMGAALAVVLVVVDELLDRVEVRRFPAAA